MDTERDLRTVAENADFLGLFTVESITGNNVILRATCDQDSPVEKRYATATPNGYIEMTINNASVTRKLAVGQKYWLPFILAAQPGETLRADFGQKVMAGTGG